MNPCITRLVSLFACAGLLAGCSTTRQEKSARAVSSMGDLRQLLSKGADQTVKLKASTDSLASAKTGDLRNAYDGFAKDATSLRGIAADVRSLKADMSSAAGAYLVNWEKELGQISNSDMKKMSRDRQALMKKEFGDITSAMGALGKAYAAYEKDIADIEKFLGNDLTQAGSTAVKPYLAKLVTEADSVISATKKAEGAVAHLEDALKPK